MATLLSRLSFKVDRDVGSAAMLAVILLALAGSVVSYVESRETIDVRKTLQSALKTSRIGVRKQLAAHQNAARIWANDSNVQAHALALLNAAPHPKSLVEHEAQESLRRWMSPLLQSLEYEGYFIVDRNHVNRAALNNRNIGGSSLLASQPELWERVWSGETVTSLPLPSDVPLIDRTGSLVEGLATMFVLTPIRDASGVIVAALTFRLDPDRSFTPIFQHANFGDTGDTYGFDRQGRLLTESRFNDQLFSLGMLDQAVHSDLILELRDPEANLTLGEAPKRERSAQPLTLPARQAIAGHDGENLRGYRDYRGVPVVGAWVWDEEMGLGIATEIDYAEAFHAFTLARSVIYVLVGLSVVLLFLVSVSSARSRREISEHLEALNFQKFALDEHAIVSITDVDGNITYVNDKFIDISGYTKEELLGQNHRLLRSEEHCDAFYAEMWDTIASGKAWNDDIKNLSKSGAEYWLNTSIVPFLGPDGTPFQYVSIRTDITELKDTGQRLRELNQDLERRIWERSEALGSSQRRFAQLLDNTNEGYWYIDPDGVTVEVNPSLCSMLGYRADEVIGQPITRFFDSENQALVARQLEVRDPEVRETYEVALKRRDGALVSCINHPTPIFDDDGEFCGSIGFYTDITPLKNANAELARAKRAAEGANEAKSAFLANMSHEIRTPMNGVVGMAEILARTGLEPEQSRMARVIMNSSRSLLRIIDDILDLSKIEAGKLGLEATSVRLRDLIEDTLAVMQSITGEHNVRLQLTYDPALPYVIAADPVRLRQILTNLLNNAIKFSRGAAQTGPKRVDLIARSTGPHHMTLSVVDRGIGMSREVQSRLFQPFMQAEQSTTREFGGTGLGLAITEKLVTMMHGTIDVDSELGRGSRFTVRLPVVEIDEVVARPDISGLTVLALADEDLDRGALRRIVEHVGSGIEFARDETDLVAKVLIARSRQTSAAAASGEPISPLVILLAWYSATDNARVMTMLEADGVEAGYICFGSSNEESRRCRAPQCYVAQRFPMFPSELEAALATAAGRPLPPSHHGPHCDHTTAADASPSDRSARLLLVEDNETNQDVISTQLRILGHRVEIAPNGAVGLDKWRAGDFDAVLTDCHMPVMDGFTLTSEIRHAEQSERRTRTPVIAITANALKGEAQRCLNAGMDSYLSKPVQLEDLARAVDQILPAPASDSPAHRGERLAPDDHPPAHGLKPVSRRGNIDPGNAAQDEGGGQASPPIVVDSALNALVGSDPGLQLDLMRRFIGPASDTVSSIDQAFEARRSAEISALGHKLMSSARTIGAYPLADLCADLEDAGERDDFARIETLHEQLGPLFDATIEFIERQSA